MRKQVKTKQLLLLLVLFLNVACGADRRPSDGSISFGAPKPPEIASSSDIRALLNAPADIAEVVLPTVVSITATKIDTVLIRNPMDHFFSGDPFSFFFGMPQQRAPRQPQQQERRRSGVGSGVIVTSDGYILTNSHVVQGATEIEVTLYDNRTFSAAIVGYDSLSDVAVIKVVGGVEGLPEAYLGDSDKLRPGEWVMAVGNPFSLSSTVTTGIVSALGRHTDGQSYQDFIQTDAAINPGNSGGALVNSDGALVGINTMIYTRSGGHMGIGFAIPINMARSIMEQLVYRGEVRRGWLGISIGEMDQRMMDAFRITKRGVLVNDIFEDSPAQKGGLRSGDVIISINGSSTETANELRNRVAQYHPGSRVTLTIIREGKEMDLTIQLGDRDGEQVPVDKSEERGQSMDELGVTLRMRGDGVVIDEVSKDSPAKRGGLKVGDRIEQVQVGGRFVDIGSIRDFQRALRNQKQGDSLLLRIERSGSRFFLAIPL